MSAPRVTSAPRPIRRGRRYARAGWPPALDKLAYLGRAITPSIQPIRFHARFFAVAHQHVHGDFGDEGELSDLQWVPIVNATKFEIMGVTLLMLESLTHFLSAPQTYQAPFLSFQRGKRTLQWA